MLEITPLRCYKEHNEWCELPDLNPRSWLVPVNWYILASLPALNIEKTAQKDVYSNWQSKTEFKLL